MEDLISRQEAIKALIKLHEETGCKTAQALRVIREMPNGWIPVMDHLPETDEMMLVTCQPKKGNANVNRAYYLSGSWHGSGSMSNVTAWMPLPEPYKEEAET